MRRRFIGLAALLMVLLTMPASRACAFASQRTSVQQDCCPHKDLADTCCMRAFTLCQATQAPVDRTQLPGQDASQLVPPPVVLAVVYQDRQDSFKPRFAALRAPREHTLPGLLMTATAVLRT